MGSVNENFKASNDEAIVKRVQEGDVEAYNLLVIKYQHKIFQVIGKFVNNQADIADVAQEAFIKAYRAINSFRADSSFYTWLYRIAVNTAKTHLESNNKTRNHLDVDSPEFQSIDEQGVLASSDTPDRIIESTSSPLVAEDHRHFSTHPILVGKPPLGVWPSRAGYHCFPMSSSLWACPRPLTPATVARTW